MAYQDRDAVIVGAVRTPVGKGKASGALHGILPADLLAHSLRELVARTGVDPAEIDDVIIGAALQQGVQTTIGRTAALRAGLGVGVAVGRAVRLAIVAINVVDFFLSFAIWGSTTSVRLAG